MRLIIIPIITIFFAGCTTATEIQSNTQSTTSPASTVQAVKVETIKPSSSPTIGKVAGKICYPSSNIPAGTIVLKNTNTNSVQNYPVKQNQSTYSIDAVAGTYHIKYVPAELNKLQENSGYYTQCVIDGLTADSNYCKNETKRVNLPVEVQSTKTTAEVDLCDFYYGEGNQPDF